MSKPKIAVISPTYNRLNHLKLLYVALKKQTRLPDGWVIADDGSDDGTGDWVQGFGDGLSSTPFLVWCCYRTDHNGYRQAEMRNMGVAEANSISLGVDAYVFVDSDVLLYSDSLELYEKAYEDNPSRVVVGQYDWGNPVEITEDTVLNHWEKIVRQDQEGKPDEDLPRIENAQAHGMQGIADIRRRSFEETTPDALHWSLATALACFGGNIMIPRKIFEEIGGYDEHYTVGIEDGDMGLMIMERGYPISLHKGIKGYHVWHPRNIGEIKKLSDEQVQYLNKKHKLDVFKESDIVHRQYWRIK